MEVVDLERQLRELGGEIAFPRTPNLARAVRARIRPQPAWRRWRVALAAAAGLLIAVAGAVALNPRRAPDGRRLPRPARLPDPEGKGAALPLPRSTAPGRSPSPRRAAWSPSRC